MCFALAIFNKMVKKLKIDFEEETSYSVIGISSSLKDYRLMFYLNRIGDFDFKKAEPFVFNIKNQDFHYSIYTYVDEFNMQNYYLISNKSNSVKLIPALKHFDYILILEGEFDEVYIGELVKKIKSVSGVMIAGEINFDIINKVPNLLFSFEMHLNNIFKTT